MQMLASSLSSEAVETAVQSILYTTTIVRSRTRASPSDVDSLAPLTLGLRTDVYRSCAAGTSHVSK